MGNLHKLFFQEFLELDNGNSNAITYFSLK